MKERIEKMANDIWYKSDVLLINDAEQLAEQLYADGYRKQSEVINEFAERLKERLFTVPTVYNSHFGRMIDDIAKEMKGE